MTGLDPGSRRYARMLLVKQSLLRHPNGLRYDQLAHNTGLSHAAACRAVQDLHYESDVITGIPAPANDYRVTLDWKKPARQGEGNQGRHNATRLEREAIRLEKVADTLPGIEAVLYRTAARQLARVAEDLRLLAEAMD